MGAWKSEWQDRIAFPTPCMIQGLTPLSNFRQSLHRNVSSHVLHRTLMNHLGLMRLKSRHTLLRSACFESYTTGPCASRTKTTECQ